MRKRGVFVRSFLSFSSQKTDLFLVTFLRFTLLLLYSSKDFCNRRRRRRSRSRRRARQSLFSVRFLSKNTFAFFAFVKSEAHFGVKAAAAQKTISNFIRERERERKCRRRRRGKRYQRTLIRRSCPRISPWTTRCAFCTTSTVARNNRKARELFPPYWRYVR